MRYMLRKAVALGLLGVSGVAYSGTSESHLFRIPTEPLVTQLIVKLQTTVGAANGRVMTQNAMNRLTASSGLPLSYKRQMSGGAHVLKLPFPMPMWQAQEYAASLRQQGDVTFAEPDGWSYPLAAVTPNDPDYAVSQWHLQDPAGGNAGAANLPLAWGETQGSSSIVVSVVDTGVLNHTELSSRLVGGSAATSGYDFISGYAVVANDGDLRDANPSDPGDGNIDPSLCDLGDSSWHGTHVAGTIGAASNNNAGMTGVDWNAKLLTARVLGVCGGFNSDIADGIAWSSGETVPSVPVNTNPAKVINLSLGGSGACGTATQNAINAAVARGSVVVVAAGNENIDASGVNPASCNNVVTVAALDQAGSKADFSNFGSVVDIAAPGVSIYSTLDTGMQSPNNSNTFATYQGTSMATPHVAGVASLMLAAQPNLTNGTVPTANVASVIESNLKASIRAFPVGSTCTTTLCGAGMLDAYRAVMAVKTPPVANAGVNQTVAKGSAVNLNATSSANNGYGTAALSSYTWIQTAGSLVVLTGANTATPSFTAPNVAGQSLTFQLTVKNDVGLTHGAAVSVQTPASNDPDSDGDGVSDANDTSPNDAKTASPPSLQGGQITLVAPQNMSNVAVLSDTDPSLPTTGKPSSSAFTFPDGVVQYTVNGTGAGATITVTLTFPTAIPAGSKVYKITAAGYAEFAGATISGNTITLTLVDGGAGDSDNAANGRIVDPVAVAVPVTSGSGGSGGGGGGGSFPLGWSSLLLIAGLLLKRHRQSSV